MGQHQVGGPFYIRACSKAGDNLSKRSWKSSILLPDANFLCGFGEDGSHVALKTRRSWFDSSSPHHFIFLRGQKPTGKHCAGDTDASSAAQQWVLAQSRATAILTTNERVGARLQEEIIYSRDKPYATLKRLITSGFIPYGELNSLPCSQFIMNIKNKPRWNPENRRIYVNERRAGVIRLLRDIRVHGQCAKCGWKEHPEILQFHHRNPALKRFPLSAGNVGMYCKSTILKEVEKCDLLCPNCHSYLHFLENANFI